MTIAPQSLAQLVAASRLEAAKAAIVAGLDALMPDVKVVGHPGKLDVNDVVAKAVVAAPGVAVGWTRIRAPRDVAGTYSQAVEWAAYVVTEDHADQATKRRIPRETVAHAIGDFLLRILSDPDASSWGLARVTPALADPAPELKPVVTMKAHEGGVTIYAVTWTQVLVDLGEPIFAGDTPTLSAADDEPGADADGVPDEVRAMLAGAEIET